MSVYRRKGSETFDYDFRFGGDRFLGNTGATEKRAALAVEKRIRAEAKELAKTKRASDSPDTWELASSRYWVEAGQHRVNKDTVFANLAWLTGEISGKTRLIDIDDNRIAMLVAKRRGEWRQVGSKTKPKRKVGPATVNRTMTEQLRKVLLRASKIWKVEIADIAWGSHMLAEPQERVREASITEEAAIMANLGRGYDAAIRFGFLNGCRRMEVVGLKKTDVDFFTRSFTVLGKGNRIRSIPMNQVTYDLLWSLKDDPTEYVFTYEAKRTDKRKEIVKGQRYPITSSGLQIAMRRAVVNAGVTNFRPHDSRHTAATRVLRKSNLRVVQILLGHADVTTTTKYAHAMAEDVRAALDAASPAKSPAVSPTDDAKDMVDLGKSG